MACSRSLLAHLLACFALALSACGEKPTPDPAPTSSAAAATATATASAPAAAVPPPVDRSPIRLTEDKTRLPLVATKWDMDLVDQYRRMWMEEDRPLYLHPLRNTMAVSYGGYVLLLEDNKLAVAASIYPEESYTFLSIGGSWPKAAIAKVYFDSWASPGYQRSPPVKETQHQVLQDGKWTERFPGSGKKFVGWRNGSLLSLQSPGVGVAMGDEKPPKQAPPGDAAACKGASAEVEVEDLDALPSGEAFVVGKRCSSGAYAVEMWRSGAAESTLEDLPDAPKSASRAFVSASAPDKAYAVLSTEAGVYAARWDGRAFRKLELSAERDVLAVWAATDGTLFLVLQMKSPTPKTAKAELVRVTVDGAVARSATFAPTPGSKLWAADAQSAYVASYASILSTKAGLTFVKPPKEEEQPKSEPKPPPPPKPTLPPYTDTCTTPFVFLYDVSDKAPAGYDFPTTRKALSLFSGVADISLVEFMHGSVRRLGVKVPSAEVGKQVIEHVLANMKDESPTLVCLVPSEGLRAIPIR